jgi:hypothetical protein
MTGQEVLMVINTLLQKVDTIISQLDEEGAELFSEGKHKEAGLLLEEINKITAFRKNVQALSQEWAG